MIHIKYCEYSIFLCPTMATFYVIYVFFFFLSLTRVQGKWQKLKQDREVRKYCISSSSFRGCFIYNSFKFGKRMRAKLLPFNLMTLMFHFERGIFKAFSHFSKHRPAPQGVCLHRLQMRRCMMSSYKIQFEITYIF